MIYAWDYNQTTKILSLTMGNYQARIVLDNPQEGIWLCQIFKRNTTLSPYNNLVEGITNTNLGVCILWAESSIIRVDNGLPVIMP